LLISVARVQATRSPRVPTFSVVGNDTTNYQNLWREIKSFFEHRPQHNRKRFMNNNGASMDENAKPRCWYCLDWIQPYANRSYKRL